MNNVNRSQQILTHQLALAVTILCILISGPNVDSFGQTTAFSYQGRLMENGNPASGLYDLTFELYDASTNGLSLGVASNSATPVSNGLFTVTLDFGTGVFDGGDRWLEIGATTNGGGVSTTLSPRQRITSAPYAIKAADAMTVDMGTISDPSFIGTTTTAPLEFEVNNTVGLRLEYPTAGTVPNLVGGSSENSVGSGTQGAVIAGGGFPGAANSIGSSSGSSTIGGGEANNIADNSVASTISGGLFNDVGVDSRYSTIGGGLDNRIDRESLASTIGGGGRNEIGVNSANSTIGGGDANLILSNSLYATISGGVFNRIGGHSGNSAIGGGRSNVIASNAVFAVIPGGRDNGVGADADYAFAAGRRAQANHPGTFVWADSADADFASTSSNQFLIRAGGGVGINKNDPATALDVGGTVTAAALDVSGTATAAAFFGDGSALTGLPNGSALDASDGSPGNALIVDATGNVGIGTATPEGDLHVRSDTSLGSLIVTPGLANSSAQLLLTENTTANLGGILRYDGTANEIQILGWSSDVATAPHLIVGRDNGRVGIGRTPASNALEVEGTASKTTSGSWLANSDRHIKTEVEAVTDALGTLEQVRLVSFRYTDDYRKAHPGVEDRRYLNVVAQEFAEVFPGHVSGSGEKLPDGSEILQVDTHPLMIYSAAAVQELNRKLERENAELRKELQDIRALVERLTAEKDRR